MSSGGAAALDRQALARLRRTMGTEPEFRSMLAEFLDSSSRLLRELHDHAGHARWPEAERSLHTLKSMARMVGASDLAEACGEAEADARNGLPRSILEGIARQAHAAQEAVRTCLA